MTTPPGPKTSSTPTLLEAELIGRIRSHGPLPVAAFMARALYDPLMGYYAQGLNFTNPAQPFGRDFTTAPLLTPLFGTTLADWVAAQWQRLNSPGNFTLAEAGPGSGALLRDVLTALRSNHPACFAAAHPHLVETSLALTTLQQRTLATFPVQWHASLTQLPTTHPILLLANELLDAFPVAVYRMHESKWQQQVVSLTEPATLTLGWRHPRHNHAPQLPLNADATPWSPAATAHLETAPGQTAWLHHLRTLLTQTTGAALLLDYGYTSLPPEGANTLQAVHRHQKVPLLHRPGATDLTAHVNFAHVQGVLGQPSQSGHCTLSDLAPFLLRHSFPRHATTAMATATPKQQQSIEAASHRLLHPNQMGALFKVLEYLTT